MIKGPDRNRGRVARLGFTLVEVLSAMVEAAMGKLTKNTAPKAAWSSLFSRRDAVGIKVNAIGGALLSPAPAWAPILTRALRMAGVEERNIIQFGTGGWRAVIGEGFTLHNVRRLCQALANDITRRGLEKRGVLIGYDRRFLSDQAAEAAADAALST